MERHTYQPQPDPTPSPCTVTYVDACRTSPLPSAALRQIPETLPAEVLAKMHGAPKPDVPLVTTAALTEADGFLLGFPTRWAASAAISQCKQVLRIFIVRWGLVSSHRSCKCLCKTDLATRRGLRPLPPKLAALRAASVECLATSSEQLTKCGAERSLYMRCAAVR